MNTSQLDDSQSLTRRAATLAIACAGVQTLSSPALAQGRVVRTLSFEELVGAAHTIVIAKLNRFLYSEIDTIDDFKPLAEVHEPIRAAVDISILRILANSTEAIKDPPTPRLGQAILNAGMDIRFLQGAYISKFIGQEAIVLLSQRISTRSTISGQPPVYRMHYGSDKGEQTPFALSRLKDVLAAALDAGFIQPL
jgi:hypothetical protein